MAEEHKAAVVGVGETLLRGLDFVLGIGEKWGAMFVFFKWDGSGTEGSFQIGIGRLTAGLRRLGRRPIF